MYISSTSKSKGARRTCLSWSYNAHTVVDPAVLSHKRHNPPPLSLAMLIRIFSIPTCLFHCSTVLSTPQLLRLPPPPSPCLRPRFHRRGTH